MKWACCKHVKGKKAGVKEICNYSTMNDMVGIITSDPCINLGITKHFI